MSVTWIALVAVRVRPQRVDRSRRLHNEANNHVADVGAAVQINERPEEVELAQGLNWLEISCAKRFSAPLFRLPHNEEADVLFPDRLFDVLQARPHSLTEILAEANAHITIVDAPLAFVKAQAPQSQALTPCRVRNPFR